MSRASKSFLIIVGTLLMFAGPSKADPPCPIGSLDRSFRMDRDLQHCVVGAAEGNAVGARHGRIYNVFCPGRMSKNQAVEVAEALARNTPPVAGNPIPSDYSALGLVPRYAFPTAARGGVADDLGGIHHWFHYECGTRGVATHVKVEIAPRRVSSLDIAKHCAKVNRAGVIRQEGRVDIEYKCKIHLFPIEREDRRGVSNCPGCTPPLVKTVARRLVAVDVQPTAQSQGLQTCLLPSTDIQCHPCTSSNKLVARMTFVRRGASCPRGSAFVPTLASSDTGRTTGPLEEAEPNEGAEPIVVALPQFLPPRVLGGTKASDTCAKEVQGRIAWDYNGSKQWANHNVARLCHNAENSSEPATCFNRVMHNGVNWGRGTRWMWQNAMDLCEGTTDADRTVACFVGQVQAGQPWRGAIDVCDT